MLRRAVAVLTLQVEQPAATVLSGTQHVKTHTRRSYLLLYCGSLVTTGWRQSDRQRVSPWSRGCADPSWILQQMKHVKAGSARERYCRRIFFFVLWSFFSGSLVKVSFAFHMGESSETHTEISSSFGTLRERSDLQFFSKKKKTKAWISQRPAVSDSRCCSDPMWIQPRPHYPI